MKLILKVMACAVMLGMISHAYAEESSYWQKKGNDDIITEDFTPKRGINSPVKESEEVIETLAENKADNWYCMHKENGERPDIPTEMTYIEDHNCYYIGKDDKVIYLTFDAGYENGNIEKILDTLKSENVPAAFFILDNLVKQNTELVKRMAEEGHTVCNHTASHRDMTAVSTCEEFGKELKKMAEYFKNTTGCEMAMYYRPPEGRFNEQNLSWADELGYKTILWSFAYADWDNNKQMDPSKAFDKVINGTHNGEVILLHPTSATNAEILPRLIKEWRNMGYRFGTLDELTQSGK